MKRRNLWIVGIGMSLAAGVLGAQPGYADPKCTLATLKGRYLFGGTATLLPPASAEPALLSVAGYHIFNGDGTGKDVLSATINGQITENQNQFPITYTVNPDCSGTYTVPDAGLSFGLFVAPNGEEVIVIGLTPGFVLVQGPNKRVSPK
jgi:hypothetical protein